MQYRYYKCPDHGMVKEHGCTAYRGGIEKKKKCTICNKQTEQLDFVLCKHHGLLSENDIKTKNKSKICRFCHRKTASMARNNDREKYNAKIAKDKEANPKKYEEFYKNHYKRLKERFGEYHSLNKQCRARGITLQDYADMIDDQQNKCAICLKEETCRDVYHDRARRLSIDHCHATKKVRGLLCQGCNVAIGRFKDDIEIMQRAIDYIKAHLQ